jgi:acyl-CoA synthetase (AMP-forming)/AMP-acid ligase II
MAGGWFHSGDLGRRDADGAIAMVGRKKSDQVGGETVVPNEIEGVLREVEASKRHAWWEWRITIGESVFMQSSPMAESPIAPTLLPRRIAAHVCRVTRCQKPGPWSMFCRQVRSVR